MSYFKKHIFFCLNQRTNGEASCGDFSPENAFNHTKSCISEKGLAGAGQVRVSRSGCLGRCDKGPVCVVYPQGHWYQFVDTTDLDEIIEEELINNRPVKRLLLD
jgi:(2Fe-2S) ferredoxin